MDIQNKFKHKEQLIIIYLHCVWNAKRKNISIKAPHQLPLIFILDRQQSKLTGLTQPWLRCLRAYIYTERVPEPNTSILFRCLSLPLFVIVKYLLLYYLYIYINIYISIYILFSQSISYIISPSILISLLFICISVSLKLKKFKYINGIYCGLYSLHCIVPYTMDRAYHVAFIHQQRNSVHLHYCYFQIRIIFATNCVQM